MAIPYETLKAMIRDFHGFPVSEEEFELISPELDSYIAEIEKLKGLDLSNVMSVRLLRAKEGDEA